MRASEYFKNYFLSKYNRYITDSDRLFKILLAKYRQPDYVFLHQYTEAFLDKPEYKELWERVENKGSDTHKSYIKRQIKNVDENRYLAHLVEKKLIELMRKTSLQDAEANQFYTVAAHFMLKGAGLAHASEGFKSLHNAFSNPPAWATGYVSVVSLEKSGRTEKSVLQTQPMNGVEGIKGASL